MKWGLFPSADIGLKKGRGSNAPAGETLSGVLFPFAFYEPLLFQRYKYPCFYRIV